MIVVQLAARFGLAGCGHRRPRYVLQSNQGQWAQPTEVSKMFLIPARAAWLPPVASYGGVAWTVRFVERGLLGALDAKGSRRQRCE